MNDKSKKSPSAETSERAADTGIRRMNVDDLLVGAREMILVHGGQDYRLRITSNGKLILTK